MEKCTVFFFSLSKNALNDNMTSTQPHFVEHYVSTMCCKNSGVAF